MEFPATLIEFQERFPDEESCWSYLRELRWPRGFRCPRCAHRHSFWLATRRLEQCAACRYQVSVTAGTVLHKTRVPLRVWLLAFFFVGRHKQGISALQLQRDTGLGSYQTAWTLLHKVRSALRPDPGRLLQGAVEADESYVGAPHEHGKRGGREVGRKTIVGAIVERTGVGGQARLAVLRGIPYERDLGPFVRGAVEGQRVVVHTDGLESYRPLRDAGLRHRRRVQRAGWRGPKLFPWSHALFSNLKSWLRGTFHGVSAKHMQRYLDEFVWRYNHRADEHALFERVAWHALAGAPFPYARLVS